MLKNYYQLALRNLEKLEKNLPVDFSQKKKLASFVEELESMATHFKELFSAESLNKKETVQDISELPAELKKDPKAYALYSDGGCRGNPGPGGWGAIAQNAKGELLFELSGAQEHTTNNQMELRGAIEGLLELKSLWEDQGISFLTPLYFYCDSRYVVDGLKSWIEGWKRRGWKKADNKPPENLALWQELDEVYQFFKNMKCIWVKGHAGHPQNEYCDQLANKEIDELDL